MKWGVGYLFCTGDQDQGGVAWLDAKIYAHLYPFMRLTAEFALVILYSIA